ncbi:hypothetical protein LINPERHAP1_LOCUS38944 [Linum perenne]
MQHQMAEIWRSGKGSVGARAKACSFQVLSRNRLEMGHGSRAVNFDNSLLVMWEINDGELPTTFPLNMVELWLQMHDLPHSFCTERVGKIMGEYVREFLKFDDKRNTQ